jgi:hypothetical protein
MNRCEECGEWTTDCQCEDHGANTEPQPAKPSGQDEKRDIEKAFSALRLAGIPCERAVTVWNGIEVLITRLHREMEAKVYEARAQGRREAAEVAVKFVNGRCYCGMTEKEGKQLRNAILGAASDEKGEAK